MASAAVATAASSSSSSSIAVNDNDRSTVSSHNNTSNNTNNNSNVSPDVAGQGAEKENSSEAMQFSCQQPQHQIQQFHDTRPASEPDSSTAWINRADAPLPGDLKRILLEVARTGTCPWLSWNQDSKDLNPSEYAAATASPGFPPVPTKTTLGAASPALARQPFSTHRRSKSSPYPSVAQGPPRKKHRNGLHKTTRKRRFSAAEANAKSGLGRKRPLVLIRTHPHTVANANAFSAPGSVGSGRTSGSEPDDSTQYECDSEGTSATTNSEVSVERLRKTQQRVNADAVPPHSKVSSATSVGEESNAPHRYKTLQESFRVALGLVLDYFYRHRGGYKLSPAEKRRNETLSSSRGAPSEKAGGDEKTISPLSSEHIFQQRRQKLMTMLLPESQMPECSGRSRKGAPADDGPPFTIQRIAEVLLSPERYYTQTHKLCNCLEKLLLVTSSTGAFGGSTGGDTSQSRREERELAALADEKGRQESELRQKRLRVRTSSPLDEMMMDSSNDGAQRNSGSMNRDEVGNHDKKRSPSPEKKADAYESALGSLSVENGGEVSDPSSREMLEAAARASLRTKFDHVGIDPHSSPDRDVRSIAENRGMTNSPPPPSLAMSAAPSNIALQGHAGVAGFVRQHLPEQNTDHHSIARVPSPILFSPGTDSPMHGASNMHMLQLHHAVALAGVSLSRAAPLDLMTLEAAGSGSTNRPGSDGGDIEVEHGRSSASNSDVDSESDDISLDDSASDRSDGSDSGSVTHHEPFTAARAMALNRMQQQQRLQSRVLTSLSSLHQSEGFRPPADSEYQSGDSIDSMRAEDSGGSDSSSSDLAD